MTCVFKSPNPVQGAAATPSTSTPHSNKPRHPSTNQLHQSRSRKANNTFNPFPRRAAAQIGHDATLISMFLVRPSRAAGGKLPPSLPSTRDRLERRIGGGWAWTFGQCPGRRGCTGLLPPPPVRDIAMSHANPVRCLLHHHVRDLSNVQETWYAIRGSSTYCVFVSSSVQSSSSPGSIRHGGGVGAAVTPGWTYSVRVCPCQSRGNSREILRPTDSKGDRKG